MCCTTDARICHKPAVSDALEVQGTAIVLGLTCHRMTRGGRCEGPGDDRGYREQVTGYGGERRDRELTTGASSPSDEDES